MAYPRSYNATGVLSRLQADHDELLIGDSYMTISAARLSDQLVNGIPRSAVNAAVWPAASFSSGILNCEIEGVVTGEQAVPSPYTIADRLAGDNIEYINANSSGGNLYRLDISTTAADSWGLPQRFAQCLKFDSALTCGANGEFFQISLAAQHTASWDHANSSNTFNIASGLGYSYKFRPIHVPTAADTVSERNAYTYDGSTKRETINFSSTNRGKRLNSENPETATFAPDYLHANAMPDTLVTNDVFSIRDHTEAATTVNSNEFINFVSVLCYRVDGNGDFVGGTLLGNVAEGSWATGGFGADASTSGDAPVNVALKSYSEAEFTHWLDSWTIDDNHLSRPSVYWWHMNPETDTAANVKTNVLAAMASIDNAHDSIGKARPFHVWIGSYVNGGDSTDSEAQNQGMYDAVVDHGNSAFISLAALTGNHDFGVSDAFTQAFIDNTVENGVLTFGTVSAQDLTAATILDGSKVHPADDNGAAFLAYLVYQELQAADLRSGTMSYETVADSYNPNHVWKMDEASGSLSDSVGTVHLATVDGAPTYGQTSLISTDTTGTSILYDGSDDGHRDVAAGWAELDPLTFQSLVCWFRCDSVPEDATEANQQTLFGLRNQGTSEDHFVVSVMYDGDADAGASSTTAKIAFKSWMLNGDDTAQNELESSNAVVTEGQVYHLVVTRALTNPDTMKMYLNGVEITDTTTASLIDIMSNDGISIGSRRATEGFFNGAIDDVRLYPTVLGQADITALYEAGQNVMLSWNAWRGW